MDNSGEICAICREDKWDFETRCGHLFHEECLIIAVFAKNSNICPYCRGEISSAKFLERFIRRKEDFESFSFGPADIDGLKQMVKYGLVSENMPVDLIAQKMVDLGWDIDELDFWLDQNTKPNKQSLFYASYYSGKCSLTSKLMNLGCKLVRDYEYESVIPRAAEINDIAFIEKLLGLGVDINSIDSTKSALHMACDTNNVGMIDFLLENGAKLTGYKREAYTYFDYEIGFGHDNRYIYVMTPLISACYYGSIDAIRRLHYHFPSIFMDDWVSWQAFAIAIIKGNITLIDVLIKLGANIKAIDSQYRRNLFMIACAMNNIEVIQHVFEKGDFDINAQDALGNSAILYPHAPEIVKFLIENGANLLAKTRDENYTILHIACENSDYDLVKYLLDATSFSTMNLKDIPRAKKGLIESCFSRILDNSEIIVDLLLQRGADINEKNFDNETAFSNACKCGIESLEFLLSRGADVNFVDSDGMNCLQRLLIPSDLFAKACAYNWLRLIKFFDSIDSEYYTTDTKRRAFAFASMSGNIEILEYLIDKFGPEYINEAYHEFYPINIAVSSRNLELFDFLAKNGANLKVNCRGRNLLEFAANSGSLEIIKKLINEYDFVLDDICTLFENIFDDSGFYQVKEHLGFAEIAEIINVQDKTDDEIEEMTKYFLDCGVDMNSACERTGDTPVTFTGDYDRERMFDLFVDYSENVLKKPFRMKNHKSLLISIARRGENMGFFEKVIRLGANVNWIGHWGDSGFTALMAACYSNNYGMCARLIELGADVNAIDGFEQYTAFHYACERSQDNIEMVEILIENGADIHALAIHRVTALHMAVESCNLKIVKKLLSIGFDPNCVNVDLHTPLHYIFHSDHGENLMLEVAKALVDSGANIYAEDEDGETPFDIADGNIKYRKLAEYFNSLS